MKQPSVRAVFATIVLFGTACGGSRWVEIPPRIDLTRHEIIGVIDFASDAEGDLARYTTQTFIDGMRVDQGMIRIVELGPEDAALSEVGMNRLDRAAFQAIGEAHGLTTIVAGQLDVSDIRPSVSIGPRLSGISAAADVDAKLNVRMIEVASGASIWSRTTEATRRVGQVSLLSGGRPRFDADDPERAYGELVAALVDVATEDFRVSWERRRN